jgi:hypothetical protein
MLRAVLVGSRQRGLALIGDALVHGRPTGVASCLALVTDAACGRATKVREAHTTALRRTRAALPYPESRRERERR